MAPENIAFIGNSSPRRCGIATFTTDLQQAVAATSADHAIETRALRTTIVAMNDGVQRYVYPETVGYAVNDQKLSDYVYAANFLNANGFEIACLQHEFGIFGGDAGDYISTMLTRLNMPVVTTLHTVLAEPNAAQRSVMTQLIERSARLVVMAQKGRELLRDVYRVADEKIAVIPHGIPDFAFSEPDLTKAEMGYSGRNVILTFGLLNPNKGIEVMIDAMPEIIEASPNVVYVVLGATHPNLVRREGEAYREKLIEQTRKLGIEDHVVFLNQFVDLPTLLRFIAMCDVYATPYLNVAQMTSGTLAYSFGLGKAVVSTPYWHAQELLADGRGVLVPFGDAHAIGREIASLLTNDARRHDMRVRAYEASRPMTWARTAERYIGVFEDAISEHQARRAVSIASTPARRVGDVVACALFRAPAQSSLPPLQLEHLHAMCDDTGLFQHAVHCVPDRSHGYCVDDNARAMLVACSLNKLGERGLPDTLTARFAAFIQHAWNPDRRRFRNFMGFERKWLEAVGSEDSHGRTLWALGECVNSDNNPSRRRWATALFAQALPTVLQFDSPRAWAFTLLGLNAYLSANEAVAPGHQREEAKQIRRLLVDKLIALLAQVRTPEWIWFEDSLAYDNARLCEALIVTGEASGDTSCVEAGLDALRWLTSIQQTPAGLFRPIGSQSFGMTRTLPQPFDQQPLEATAAIAAYHAAWRIDADESWLAEADRAFAWFLGANDLSIPLVDVATGSCRDGLHPRRANENRGGESAVSYLLALADMRQMAQLRAPFSKLAQQLVALPHLSEIQ
jgi:glycosyltransferase involved in cell wall biosynthesis